jgi:lipopolysaccharide export system ATP-binding protein
MIQLRANNLTKSYKKRCVVNDISLDVKQGEIVGLLGPNGAGKTTCFYMLVGLISPDSGTVYLGDEDITTFPMHLRARRGIGYLPQEPSIFRKLSVKNNILAILETLPLTREERLQKLQMLLEEFHIDHIQDNMGISLSGGERRRVEIARAVACEPKFILLDEPFAGVDPISIVDIKQMIEHLSKRGIGIIITDHNVRETLDICECAYIMNEGKLLIKGTADEILKNQAVRSVYLGENFYL